MYFIPRNNKVYHYIAHTSVRNRYLCTGFFLLAVFVIAYFMQCLVTTYSDIYIQELASLQKICRDSELVERKNKQLIVAIEETKKDIQLQIHDEHAHDYCKKQLSFVLEAIKTVGLKLNSYGVQKEKNKGWYVKERAHIDVSGSLKQIMDFFEIIKNSKKMISVAEWTLARIDENTLRAECDMEFIFILQGVPG